MCINMDYVEEIIEFFYLLGICMFVMNGMIYLGGGFFIGVVIDEKEMLVLLVCVCDKVQELGMCFFWYMFMEYCCMLSVELEIGVKCCNVGEYLLCIELNGDVLFCQFYYVLVGNILNDFWEKIWDGELFCLFCYCEEDFKGYGLLEKCWICLDLLLCGGGCCIECEVWDGVCVVVDGGGGCLGCSGSCGMGGVVYQVKIYVYIVGYIDMGGFIFLLSIMCIKVWLSGNMVLIGLEEV